MSKLIPLLIASTGLSERDIRRIVANAPVRYKTYEIPKRVKGTRTISQPAREVKLLQRALITHVLENLPVHSTATAYRKNISIRQNAEAHVNNGPIFKFDFENFFPSIIARDWRQYCEKNSIFDNPEDIFISTQILFHKAKKRHHLSLAIGAPSSPILSNILMYEFDQKISELVAHDKVTYTRYADDLTFSAMRTGYLTGVEKTLRSTLREMYSPSLKINESKTKLATKKYKRFVTGLVLSNDGKVSAGYDRKRNLRAAVHHAAQGKLNSEELVQLSGLLAFVHAVEPEFLKRLTEKFGESTINKIKSARKPTIANSAENDLPK